MGVGWRKITNSAVEMVRIMVRRNVRLKQIRCRWGTGVVIVVVGDGGAAIIAGVMCVRTYH